jgi:hypothetical protein
MSSDTSARGDTPALEPQADLAAAGGRRASDFAALAPDPAHDLVPMVPPATFPGAGAGAGAGTGPAAGGDAGRLTPAADPVSP